ncbi:RNA polymerase sigma factor (sigma-70 family) [Clostridium moniliforme]|uniref:RNA polymerase sigma factor (Sigma-70 family) n=1 Tax=Clostridium moniliforme TaxID=39489 RepID=A0ABS4EYV0_9CLOT|nr:sigma-70 family RNA polymerase sigma factor [Clostridium moniliforme]MBP1889177.1 RNA polymerase sigma factor (sigma-70 family) [Clostridium moniliforme]
MCDVNLIKLAKENNLEAKEKLINKYSPIIKKQIKKYSFIDCYDNEDLMQYGIMSILKAINTFDIEKSPSFSAYVKFAIYNNFAYLCRQNNINNKASSLNLQTEEGSEIIDLIEDKLTVEDIFINNYENDRIYKALNILNYEEKRLFKFLMYSGIKCPLKRYSEIYKIKYSTCLYKKSKLAKKLKKILLTI